MKIYAGEISSEDSGEWPVVSGSVRLANGHSLIVDSARVMLGADSPRTASTNHLPLITTNCHSMPTILVVEDEAKMRRLLELNLAEEGYTVLTAPDAEAGLNILRQEKIDLIVTDLRCPE